MMQSYGTLFILFYFILFYFILFYFILFYFILFHFILFFQRKKIGEKQRKGENKEKKGGTFTTVILFWVRVPVLSEQMAIVDD